MTYDVFGGTLNLTQSINVKQYLTVEWCPCNQAVKWQRQRQSDDDDDDVICGWQAKAPDAKLLPVREDAEELVSVLSEHDTQASIVCITCWGW